MEREKEEIQKKVCIACGKCKELKGDCYLAKNIATVLIADNYSKVPARAIVLTKEECDSKVILDEDHFLRVLDNERERGRKETAREILDEVFSDTYSIGGGLYELTPKDKKILYKKYGVEVEQ